MVSRLKKVFPKGKIDCKGGFSGKQKLNSAIRRALRLGFVVDLSNDTASQSSSVRETVTLIHPVDNLKIEFSYFFGSTKDQNRFVGKVIS